MKIDVSLIVPTFNRCETLKTALKALMELESSGAFRYEIVIVDNNSKDQTRDVVKSYQSRSPVPIAYVFEPNQGISHARNCGAKEAKGEIIVFTDDDCVPKPDWLNNVYELFQKYEVDAMGGCILPQYPQATPKWIIENKELLRGPIVFHDYGQVTKLYEKPMVEFVGANIAFRKAVFQKCGYFRTDLGVGKGTMGEETEFFARLQSKGCKIYYCGKAVVWHPVPVSRLNLRYIARWNIGLGRYRFLVDEKGVMAKGLTCYFGVPWYLIKEMLGHTGLLVLNAMNQKRFLREWKSLTIKIGRASAMRQTYLANVQNKSLQCEPKL